jgi:hypothetical protein
VENQRKLNNIQELQFWKPSQPVRQRFNRVQSERAGTVSVILGATKMGASLRRAQEEELKALL